MPDSRGGAFNPAVGYRCWPTVLRGAPDRRVFRPGVDCAHCGGSGLLVKVDPAEPWIVDYHARTKRPNATSDPYPCNFCWGTGRDSRAPEAGDDA